MRNGAGQVVATHSKRRGESAVVESRVDLVEGGMILRSNAIGKCGIGGTLTSGRIACGIAASGRRLEVALPLCESEIVAVGDSK